MFRRQRKAQSPIYYGRWGFFFSGILVVMANKSRSASTRNDNRPSGKGAKKRPKKFDPIKRRLVTA